MNTGFDVWWESEGREMAEKNARHAAEVAWSNGAYLSRKHAEELQQIAEAVGLPFAPGREVVRRVREIA